MGGYWAAARCATCEREIKAEGKTRKAALEELRTKLVQDRWQIVLLPPKRGRRKADQRGNVCGSCYRRLRPVKLASRADVACGYDWGRVVRIA